MARLSWNEIQDRAAKFSAKYKGETYEKGESQSFWSDFLYVFGIDRKRYGAFFEYAIKKNGGAQGFIDMFWPGKLLAEQKSAGRDLTKATTQAFDYLHNMPDHDLPQGIVVSDFATFQFIDLETRAVTEFTLDNLHKNVQLFGFLIEQTSKKLAEENPVNRKAAEAMAELHNTLRDTGYSGHDLEVLLVRLVFCLFADDSGIFAHRSFEAYFYNRTEVDGSDFGPRLNKLFEVLNTPENARSTLLDADLVSFPYINGGLFAENIRTPDFNYAMRDALLKAMELDWSQVSPAIFGSMFQGVMDEKERRSLGAHYTSEKNILKVIKPLFLDDLYNGFARIKHRKSELIKFHDKLRTLTFLDPACGCGNFLVITYRELRRLEHKVIEAQYGKNLGLFEVGDHGVVKCDVDQMYGIELEEFPSLIAETALWLTDHQMNLEFSQQSGHTFKRLPLKKRANIHHANALALDWAEVIEPANLNYILGNPPFSGKSNQSIGQKADLLLTTKGIKNSSDLDFVSAWYVKSAKFIQGTNIRVALVSTNSICQGEQVGILWPYLFEKGMHINFAYQTFKWANDAKGKAAVHCVIIGFSTSRRPVNYIYSELDGDSLVKSVESISPYLVEGPQLAIVKTAKPFNKQIPLMRYGNKPSDDGNLLLSDDEATQLQKDYPEIKPYIKKYLGAKEVINGGHRWCLWFDEAPTADIRKIKPVMERIHAVKLFREASTSPSTKESASVPYYFYYRSHPNTPYLVVPETSSENRKYIPIAYLDANTICSNSCYMIPSSNLYIFGLVTSNMHMAWVRIIAGRLKSDYRYTGSLIYNAFPWPEQVSDEQKAETEKLAQAVLDARAEHPNATLADLYDPLTMPPDLMKAHKTLDKAVDKLYSKKPFANDAERVALLFELYQLKAI